MPTKPRCSSAVVVVARTLLLLAATRGVRPCDVPCYNTCVRTCEALCDQSDDCAAVVMTYVPGEAGGGGGGGATAAPATDDYGASNVPAAQAPTFGVYQCGFTSCVTTRPWNGEAFIKTSKGMYREMPGTVVVCPKNATIPHVGAGKNLTVQACVLGPRGNATNNCKAADYTRKRHNTLWLPGVPANVTAADVVATLTKHAGAYDTISMPWAWMNSRGPTWNNTKCANDTAGLCGRSYSAISQGIADSFKHAKFRFVPMIQVCAVCVLNGTWDWLPAIKLLEADAKQHGFSGYSLDMEMGGAFNLSGRATFLDAFSDMVHGLGADTTEVQWFSHWRWWPDLSMPNDADWLVCMDSYGPRVAYFAGYWYHTYACKASVGLSYPGDSLTAMQAFFPQLISQSSPQSGSMGMYRSIGTWGMPADDGTPMAELWWSSLKSFLVADERRGNLPIAQAPALKTTDDASAQPEGAAWDPCKRKCHSQLWLPGIDHSPGRMHGYISQFNQSYDTWSTPSSPNHADAVISMDFYRYPNDNMLTSWVKAFKCQASLGLEYGAPIGAQQPHTVILKTTDASAQTATVAVPAPPFWTVNSTCLRRCEEFCANSSLCLAVAFGRNFNHGLLCNFHRCNKLVNRTDHILWVTFTRDSNSSTTTFTEHQFEYPDCVVPNRPPLDDFNCMKPGPPPSPRPAPPGPHPSPPPPLVNCTPQELTSPRHSSLWMPGVVNGTGQQWANYLKVHRASYDTLTHTWAFWNSKFNSKCNDTGYAGKELGVCGRAWSPDEQIVVNAAKELNMRIVPNLEVCCACVLNATNLNYTEAMSLLVADAKEQGFDGYVLDMICGGHQGRDVQGKDQRANFLSAFKAELSASSGNSSAEVSWFSHGFYHPEASFPNSAE